MNPDEILHAEMAQLIRSRGGNYKPDKPFIFGISNEADFNTFNDRIGILYPEDKIFICPATTEHGDKYKTSSLLDLGIHNDIWEIGIRKNFYDWKELEVFRQNGSYVHQQRDDNADGIRNDKEIYIQDEIQCHPSGNTNTTGRKVGGASAGCQVIERISDWWILFNICKEYDKSTHKVNRWSYALFSIHDKDLPEQLKS